MAYQHSFSKQQGAVAIEFAGIFLLFFTLVYGVLAFGIPALLQLSFQHLSAEASRSAIKVDRNQSSAAFAALVSQEVSQTIAASWLPVAWRNTCPAPSLAGSWQQLPAQNGQPSYGYLQTEIGSAPYSYTRYRLYVCMQTNDPIVPQLVLGGIRLPDLPLDDDGVPVIRANTLSNL